MGSHKFIAFLHQFIGVSLQSYVSGSLHSELRVSGREINVDGSRQRVMSDEAPKSTQSKFDYSYAVLELLSKAIHY